MPGNVWNPSAPTTMGLEWFPTLYGLWNLRDTSPWAQRIRSRSAQTINALKTMVTLAGDTLTDVLLAEIFTAGGESTPAGSVTTALYEPSADVTVGAGWQTQAGAVINLFQQIDEGSAAINDADYIKIGNVAAADYICRFGAAGFPGTARVLGVKVFLRIQASTSNGAQALVYLRHTPSATDYQLVPAAPIATPTATSYLIDCGEINPKTLLPWTPTDIQGFGAGGALWAFKVNSSGNGTTDFRITALELQVTYRTSEDRVAAASYLKPLGVVTASGPVTLNNFVALPGAGATWAKPASGDFTVLFRQPNAVLVYKTAQRSPISIPWLGPDNLAYPPVPGVRSSSLGATYNAATGVVTANFSGTWSGWLVPLLVMTSAPAVSDDSQPYYLTVDATRIKYVQSGQPITQLFTPTATASYGVLQLLLGPSQAVAALNVKIKRVSDNVQFGTTATVTVAQAQAGTALTSGGVPNFYLVQVLLPAAAALVNGTQYYIELTCADVTSGWQVILLGDATLAGDAATFGGATDVAKLNGVAQNSFDISATIAQIPTAPTNQAAAIVQTVPANAAVATGCGIPSIQQPRLTWTKTTLGATFTRYEIQRTEDLGVTWATVAYISLEATVSWTDQEAKRGLPVQYRLRVLRSDGAASNWTPATIGITPQAVGCEVIFSSNEQPTMMCAYNREPSQRYTFLAPQRDALVEIYGADFAVAFMESEDPGITVEEALVVNFKDTPPVDDVAIFAPLRNLCRAVASYVCVLDFVGNRFFAHVQFTEGTWTMPEYDYHATAVVSEITDTPSIAVA